MSACRRAGCAAPCDATDTSSEAALQRDPSCVQLLAEGVACRGKPCDQQDDQVRQVDRCRRAAESTEREPAYELHAVVKRRCLGNPPHRPGEPIDRKEDAGCLLYTSDAADE